MNSFAHLVQFLVLQVILFIIKEKRHKKKMLNYNNIACMMDIK